MPLGEIMLGSCAASIASLLLVKEKVAAKRPDEVYRAIEEWREPNSDGPVNLTRRSLRSLTPSL
jgi:hypothetical protein